MHAEAAACTAGRAGHKIEFRLTGKRLCIQFLNGVFLRKGLAKTCSYSYHSKCVFISVLWHWYEFSLMREAELWTVPAPSFFVAKPLYIQALQFVKIPLKKRAAKYGTL